MESDVVMGLDGCVASDAVPEQAVLVPLRQHVSLDATSVSATGQLEILGLNLGVGGDGVPLG